MRTTDRKKARRPSDETNAIVKELRTIPGVGKSVAQDFLDLGVRSVEELVDRDPDELYERLCLLKGCRLDRCMLNVFRCAVYYASNAAHDPELLKWWNWKDHERVGP